MFKVTSLSLPFTSNLALALPEKVLKVTCFDRMAASLLLISFTLTAATLSAMGALYHHQLF
jgi:hypothetical protein